MLADVTSLSNNIPVYFQYKVITKMSSNAPSLVITVITRGSPLHCFCPNNRRNETMIIIVGIVIIIIMANAKT